MSLVSYTVLYWQSCTVLNNMRDVQLFRLGACRTPAVSFRTPQHSFAYIRSLSALPASHLSPRAPVFPRSAPTALGQGQSRLLSLGSIFRRATSLPTPEVVSNISKLEAEADARPDDVEKQVSLFEALVNTKVKPGLNTVVARWERTSEFVSTLPTWPSR